MMYNSSKKTSSRLWSVICFVLVFVGSLGNRRCGEGYLCLVDVAPGTPRTKRTKKVTSDCWFNARQRVCLVLSTKVECVGRGEHLSSQVYAMRQKAGRALLSRLEQALKIGSAEVAPNIP